MDGIDAKTQISNLDAEVARITNLNVLNANIQNLKANKADILDLNAINAKVGTLEVNKADITQLNAQSAKIDDLYANKATVKDLEANTGKITTLESRAGSIEHILAGNIGAENIKAKAITAGSGIIADGAIGDAQISNLSASKLRAGAIDTSLVTVAGADGKLNITGNRLQVINNGLERVALGDIKRDGSVFGLVVRGEDGKTVLLDQSGVRNAGITKGAIDDSKVADDANIKGSKLDINSVVRQVNEKGTETIKGTKVQVGDRSLDVELSTIKSNVDNIQVGGRNLIRLSYIVNKGCSKFNYDSSTNTWDCVAPKGSTSWGYGFYISSNKNIPVERGKTFIVGFEVNPAVDCSWNNDVNNSYVGNTGGSNDNDDYSKRNSNRGTLKANTWNKCWFSYTAKDDVTYDLYDTSSNWGIITTSATEDIKFKFRNVKGEYGNKPTDWTPAPEDVQGQIDAHSTQISEQKTTIQALDNSIRIKVDNQTFNQYKATTEGNISTINTNLSKATSDISILQGEITSKVSQSDIDKSINNISIGGRNLLKNSGTVITNGNYQVASYPTYSPLKPNKKYTVVFKGSVNVGNKIGVWWNYGSYGAKIFDRLDDGSIYTAVITTPSSLTYNGISFYNYPSSTAKTCTIEWACLYEGDVKPPTSWSPAPEDIEQNATDTAKVYADAQIKGVEGKIQTVDTKINNANSEIKQLKDSISLKVETSDFQSTVTTVNGEIASAKERVSNTENSINILKGQIALKVTKDDVDKSIGESKKIADTRNDNQPPIWYWSNYPQQVVTEYKNRNIVGVQGSASYGTLITTVPWNAPGRGSKIVQVFKSSDGTFERTEDTFQTWSIWKEKEDTDGSQQKINSYDQNTVAPLKERVTSAESNIVLLGDQIRSKVDVNGVKSFVEQNPNSVKIGFNKITPDVNLSNSGSLEIHNGNIKVYNNNNVVTIDGSKRMFRILSYGNGSIVIPNKQTSAMVTIPHNIGKAPAFKGQWLNTAEEVYSDPMSVMVWDADTNNIQTRIYGRMWATTSELKMQVVRRKLEQNSGQLTFYYRYFIYEGVDF